MAYDEANDQVVMFGGQGFQFFGDTWTWNGTNWTQQHPASTPTVRWGPGLGYDQVNQRAVLFGGETTSGPLGDTWTWDGANWTQQSPADSPAPRFRFPTAWSANGQVLLFGGVGVTIYGDTWTWDGSNWILR